MLDTAASSANGPRSRYHHYLETAARFIDIRAPSAASVMKSKTETRFWPQTLVLIFINYGDVFRAMVRIRQTRPRLGEQLIPGQSPSGIKLIKAERAELLARSRRYTATARSLS
jgi:hypothetical protein